MEELVSAKAEGHAQHTTWLLALALFFLLIVTVNLGSVPRLWWDEGWTLNVARNWVELGHFGQLQAGAPRGPGLSATPPVVLPVALSFRLFGVGIWQGRLPGVLFLLGSLALFFFLGSHLYNRRIAWAALGVALLMSAADQLNPLLVGRQVLGEMPAIFYLLVGYTCLLFALRRSTWFILLAILFWGLALITKAQVLPFWVASLLLPLMVALLRRWWRQALILVLGMLGAWYASGWLNTLIWSRLRVLGQSEGALAGIYQVTAAVPNLQVRLAALVITLLFGLPALLGLGYAAWGALNHLRRPVEDPALELMRLSLLGLAGSWLAWFVLLAMPYTRYLFPPVFLGSLFAAVFLERLTGGFDLKATVLQATAPLLQRRADRRSLGALLAVLLVALTVPMTILVLSLNFARGAQAAPEQVAAYLNTHTPQNALVETYESELFFLLDRPYHYPPDAVSVQMVQSSYLDPSQRLAYDPLPANPDYLVVGAFAKEWKIYDQALTSGQFRLLQSFPGYDLYARLRP